MLPGGRTDYGRIGSGLEAARWLEGTHSGCNLLDSVGEAEVWVFEHMDLASMIVVVVGGRSLHYGRMKDELIVDGLIAGVLIEVGASLELGTGQQSLWLGIL